jgi:16S rRNA (adenine1518-N6/adenine1519-N6)-dimethyltransferase
MMHRIQGGESKIPNPKSKTGRRRPKLGQHFLQDTHYRKMILDQLRLPADALVIEIGPGRGALTRQLAERVRKVVAIEVDSSLAHRLQEEYSGMAHVIIPQADVLTVDFAEVCREQGASECWVVGNLPYYITSPILQHLFAYRKRIRVMGLLVQQEVAERLTAEPGTRDYGYLTVLAQLYSQPRIVLSVPPGAFSPPPKVHSALVTFPMKPRFPDWTEEDNAKFLEFAKRCFARKRKTLLNNLSESFPRQQVAQALAGVAKNPSVRAEQLSLEELAGVFDGLRRLEGLNPNPGT